MNVELFAVTGVAGRNDKRPPVDAKTDVTDKAFVQDRIYDFAIEIAALRQSLQSGALSLL